MMLAALLVGGVSLAGPPPPVVGGTPVADGDWPAVALIWFGPEPACTGVLVEPDLVVSAGHCGRPATHVSLGHTHLDDAERVRIAERWIHPRWVTTLDLAAFRLARPVEGIAPHALSADGLEDGAPVTIVGWGATDVDAWEYPDVMMEGEATVWDADCSGSDWGCMPQVAPGGELVAGADGVDSCSGDSGGPLFLGTGADAVVVGITSRGIDSTGPECGDGGIYVRGDATAAWLESLASDTGAPDTAPPDDEDDDEIDPFSGGGFTGGACATGLPASGPLSLLVLLALGRRRRR